MSAARISAGGSGRRARSGSPSTVRRVRGRARSPTPPPPPLPPAAAHAAASGPHVAAGGGPEAVSGAAAAVSVAADFGSTEALRSLLEGRAAAAADAASAAAHAAEQYARTEAQQREAALRAATEAVAADRLRQEAAAAQARSVSLADQAAALAQQAAAARDEAARVRQEEDRAQAAALAAQRASEAAQQEVVAAKQLSFLQQLQAHGLPFPPDGQFNRLTFCDLCMEVKVDALSCGGPLAPGDKVPHGVCITCLPVYLDSSLEQARLRGPGCFCMRHFASGPMGCQASQPLPFSQLRFGLDVLCAIRGPQAGAQHTLLHMEALPLLLQARAEERSAAEAAARAAAVEGGGGAAAAHPLKVIELGCIRFGCPGCNEPATVTDEGTCLVGESPCGLFYCTVCNSFGTKGSDKRVIHEHIELCGANVFPGGYFGRDRPSQLAMSRCWAAAELLTRDAALRAALAPGSLRDTLESASDDVIGSLYDAGIFITDEGLLLPDLNRFAPSWRYALPRMAHNLAARASCMPSLPLCHLNDRPTLSAISAQFVDCSVNDLSRRLVRAARPDAAEADKVSASAHFMRLGTLATKLQFIHPVTAEAQFVMQLAARHLEAVRVAAAARGLDAAGVAFLNGLLVYCPSYSLPSFAEAEQAWRAPPERSLWARRLETALPRLAAAKAAYTLAEAQRLNVAWVKACEVAVESSEPNVEEATRALMHAFRARASAADAAEQLRARDPAAAEPLLQALRALETLPNDNFDRYARMWLARAHASYYSNAGEYEAAAVSELAALRMFAPRAAIMDAVDRAHDLLRNGQTLEDAARVVEAARLAPEAAAGAAAAEDPAPGMADFLRRARDFLWASAARGIVYEPDLAALLMRGPTLEARGALRRAADVMRRGGSEDEARAFLSYDAIARAPVAPPRMAAAAAPAAPGAHPFAPPAQPMADAAQPVGAGLAPPAAAAAPAAAEEEDVIVIESDEEMEEDSDGDDDDEDDSDWEA